jgi:DNA-binding MarR family transcriptional regulator
MYAMTNVIGTERRVALEPWVRFLRAHAAVTRELSAELVRTHDLTINDYEVLLHLSRAEGRQLRRVDLAERVLLTASGITRLLDGLERAGLVEKRPCESDGRVSYAALTDAGLAKLREASETHIAGVERLFLGRFDADERAVLGELLGRLPGNAAEVDEAECRPA